MQGTLPFTLFILTLSQSLPVYSHSHSGSLPVYSLTQACCLSILTPANSLPTYSHTIRLTAIHSHSQACCLSILSLSLRLAACLFSHYQASAYLFSHHLACCLSVLTPSGLLPICSHTIWLAATYSHTIRLTLYLFSLSSYCLSVLTPNAVLLSSSPMYLCALSGSLPMYSRTQTSHLSSPTTGYLVPTIRFAAYLALVCCLATARLTTGVVSCLSKNQQQIVISVVAFCINER